MQIIPNLADSKAHELWFFLFHHNFCRTSFCLFTVCVWCLQQPSSCHSYSDHTPLLKFLRTLALTNNLTRKYDAVHVSVRMDESPTNEWFGNPFNNFRNNRKRIFSVGPPTSFFELLMNRVVSGLEKYIYLMEKHKNARI